MATLGDGTEKLRWRRRRGAVKSAPFSVVAAAVTAGRFQKYPGRSVRVSKLEVCKCYLENGII